MKLQILGPSHATCHTLTTVAAQPSKRLGCPMKSKIHRPESQRGVQCDAQEFHGGVIPYSETASAGQNECLRPDQFRAPASENESKPMKTKPECYGTMFPDLSKMEFNTSHEGKAFTVLVGSGMGITDRQSSVKDEAWEACAECPEYNRYYDLSVAKLLLHQAIQSYGSTRAL